MGNIHVLDKNTIDQIAAGEVVERPSSIVKELVENAIDAKSSAVTVEIKEGGISFIRITDNGSGIPKDQVPTAFLRHATSKLNTADDLSSISSLGFRGEALSSISAVSEMEVITKTSDELTGLKYCIEGGSEVSKEEIGAPSGTTFIVKNLFYNTPARKKFLKSERAEGNAITAIMEQLALCKPDISFKYILNGSVKLHSSGTGNLKELIYHIFGREIARELTEVSFKSDYMNVSGFVGKPNVSRASRNFENYYVNGRYVKSKLLAKAIEDGYHGFLMQHSYPFTLLYIDIDQTQVDVNVHPQKMELRFSHQDDIYHYLMQAVKEALYKKEDIPSTRLDKEIQKKDVLPPKYKAPEPFEYNRRAKERKNPNGFVRDGNLPFLPESDTVKASSLPITEAASDTVITEETQDTVKKTPGKALTENPIENPIGTSTENPIKGSIVKPFGASPENPIGTSTENPIEASPENSIEASTGATIRKEPPILQKPEQLELFQEKFLSEKAKQHTRIIGQLFETYWLVEFGENLYIIDQHAAHEKVLYEKLMKDYRNKEIYSQFISPPLVVSLTPVEASLLEEHIGVFKSFGFEIEAFGGKDYKVNAVPSNLYGLADRAIFTEVMDSLFELGQGTDELIGHRLATMACKAAVKGNQKLSTSEASALIDELLTLENPYRCPHGRPTIISMSKYEIEKKFKRIT